MSLFDTLSKKLSAGTQKVGGLFGTLKDKLGINDENVNALDVIYNIPAGTKDYLKRIKEGAPGKGVEIVTKEIPKAAGRFTLSAGEAIPRLISPKLSTKVSKPIDVPYIGPIESYQSETVRNVKEGMSPGKAILKSFTNVALDEPLGVAAKPLIFAAGTLLRKGGAKVIKEAIDTIAKTQDKEAISTELKKVFKGSDEEISNLSDQLITVNDPKQVNSIINNATDAKYQRDLLIDRVAESKPDSTQFMKADGTVDLDKFGRHEDLVEKAKSRKITDDELREALDIINKQPPRNPTGRGMAGDVVPPKGTKERGLVTTIKESDKFLPGVRGKVSGRYNPITNRETLEQATRIVDDQIDEAYRIAKDPTRRSAVDNMVSEVLMERLQKEAAAVEKTNPTRYGKLIDDVVDLAEILAQKGTDLGQAVQAFARLAKVSPEGVVNFAQRVINRAKKVDPSLKTKLTKENVTNFRKKAEEIAKMPESRAKMVKTAELIRDIHALVPSSLAKKISTIQTFAQLLNPKTPIRNIFGNSGFAVAENVSDIVGAVIESPLVLFGGKRSTFFPSFKTQARGFVRGFKEGFQDALKGINTGPGTQFDLPQTPVFRGTVGKAFERLLNLTLRPMDRAFFQAAHDNSLWKQMKAAGVKAPTEEMKEVAIFEGMYRTFQDDSALSGLFVGMKKHLNFKQEFGMGDIILKYPKTPANLLSRGLAYSPAGFVKAVFELARPLVGKSKFNQKKFVDSLSRAIVGTSAAFGIGATLYDLGIISTTREKDYDVAEMKKQVGLGEFKMNLSALKRFVFSGFDPNEAKLKEGDTLVSYDWFQPGAISLTLGADFAKNKGASTSMLGVLADAVGTGVDSLAEQPLISGVTNFIKYGDISDSIVKTLERVPSSFTPTLLNQVRQLIDNNKREVYNPNPVTYSLNLVRNRIPGLSETLPEKMSAFGDTIEMYQGGTNNPFNVFFNPAFVTKYQLTPEAKMVIDLYNETGETKHFPRVQKKKIKVNGVDKQLSPEEYEKMQRYTGTVSKELFALYANDPKFQALPEDKKISELQSTLTAIGAAGKIIILKDRPKKKPSQKVMNLVRMYMEQNSR